MGRLLRLPVGRGEQRIQCYAARYEPLGDEDKVYSWIKTVDGGQQARLRPVPWPARRPAALALARARVVAVWVPALKHPRPSGACTVRCAAPQPPESR